MAGNSKRKGAVSGKAPKPKLGTGGNNKRRLAGKGPTPKAEERTYHPAAKRKAAAMKRVPARASGARSGRPTRPRKTGDEVVAGRNSVLEALRAEIPAKELIIAHRLESDGRTQEILTLALEQKVTIREATREEIDALTEYGIHQGVALRLPEYQYYEPNELIEAIKGQGKAPLLVALDGITDPRNLGAILRSAGAFGAHAVVITERRSAGLTAAAWKSSAGAAARVPVARVTNMVRWLEEAKKAGCFVVGLDAEGDVQLPKFDNGSDSLIVVVGSEGKGLGRLVSETCDFILSIPICRTTESLNAGIASSVVLYAISQQRATAIVREQ